MIQRWSQGETDTTRFGCESETPGGHPQRENKARGLLTVRAILRQQGGLKPRKPLLLLSHELLEGKRVAS